MNTIVFIGWGNSLAPEMLIKPGIEAEANMVAYKSGNDVFVEIQEDLPTEKLASFMDAVQLAAVEGGASISDLREPYVVVK